MNSELGRDLGRIQYLSSRDGCGAHRLDEIEKWLNSHRSGRPLALNANVNAPPIFWGMSTSVWEVVKSGQVAAHMPLADELAYASLYDSLKSFETNQHTQREAWADLGSLYGVRQLDDKDIAHGLGLIARIRLTRSGNSRLLKLRTDEIRRLGLAPEKTAAPDQTRAASLCASVFDGA